MAMSGQPNPNPGPAIRRGSCLCGRSQLVITGEPMTVTVCHCLNCKKATGSAFANNALFRKDQVDIQTPATLTTFSDSNNLSGNTLHRTFCSTCGSLFPLTSSRGDDLVAVPVASVENGGGWKPKWEFFCVDRWAWVPELEGTRKPAVGEDVDLLSEDAS